MTLSRRELVKKLEIGDVVETTDGQYVVLDTQQPPSYTGGLILSVQPPKLHVVNSCVLNPRADKVIGQWERDKIRTGIQNGDSASRIKKIWGNI